MVGGTRPAITAAQVQEHLETFFHVPAQHVRVRRYFPDDFLLVFNSRTTADRVLHAPPLEGTEFTLRFRRWSRQSRALFKPLRYKVLIAGRRQFTSGSVVG
jgi:hypothetical protein